jgi:co-chaperonin GroES (HSP10)
MSLSNVEVKHNRVFVKPDVEASPAGILLPENPNQKIAKGTVEGVGPGVYQSGIFIVSCVKVGDRILYLNSKNEIKVDGEKYIVISDADVLCVYK